jgi:tellurite resistance protein
VASLDKELAKEQATPVRAELQVLREQLSRGLRDHDPPRTPEPRHSKPHPLLELSLQTLVARLEKNDYGVTPIVDLGTMVANADGTIDPEEIDVLRYLFQESLGTRLSPQMVEHLITSSLEATARTDAAQRAKLVTEILLDCDAVEEGLTVALAVAFASEGLSPSEQSLIASIAARAGVSPPRLEALVAQVKSWDIAAMISAAPSS